MEDKTDTLEHVAVAWLNVVERITENVRSAWVTADWKDMQNWLNCLTVEAALFSEEIETRLKRGEK